MNNDLISRERLKNTILLGNYDTQSKILSAIDNAPTVNPSLNLDNITKEDIEKFKTIWQRATSKGLHTFIEDRPQGEWKLVSDINNDINVVCPFCNKTRIFAYAHGYSIEEVKSQLQEVNDLPNYCENCGADMRGGAE